MNWISEKANNFLNSVKHMLLKTFLQVNTSTSCSSICVITKWLFIFFYRLGHRSGNVVVMVQACYTKPLGKEILTSLDFCYWKEPASTVKTIWGENHWWLSFKMVETGQTSHLMFHSTLSVGSLFNCRPSICCVISLQSWKRIISFNSLHVIIKHVPLRSPLFREQLNVTD